MDRETTMDDFDRGFDNMMSSALEYEILTRQGKPIPRELQDRLDESRDWLNGLSDSDYNRLIH